MATTVDEYLAAVGEPARSTLSKIRAVIRRTVPVDATEAISYGIPMFRWNGALVGYAAFSKHCSFFPMGSAVLKEFEDELKGYDMRKGTIHFPLDKPLSATLVRKLVKARMAANERKKKR